MSVGWSLSVSSWTVNAEDVEIISVSDPGTWAAFKFFELYGYTSDFQTTEEQIFTTSGTTTLNGNFTFSGSFSGSFDATVEMSVDTLIGTELADVDNILTGYTHYYLDKDEVKLTIHPKDYETQQNNGFAFACTYNAQSTAANAQMNCNPTSGLAETVILPDQEITFDSIDTLFNSVTNYSIALTMKNQGTEVGTITGTLGGSVGGSGTVQLSGVYDESTVTTNKQSYKFTMPYMTNKSGKWSLLSGGYQNSFKVPNDDIYVIAFLSKTFPNINIYDLGDRPYVHPLNSNYVTSRSTNIIGYNSAAGGLFITCLEVKNYNDKYLIMNPINNSVQALDIYPLYFGRLSQMSDEMYRFIYHGDRTIDKINEQIAADQQHHDEMMDTSDSAKIQTDGDALVADADEKFGDLFFPLNHAIETANDLANVDATGVIRLPAIFSDGDYWYLDLTQIEKNLPQAWTFIQSLCQLAVAIYMIHGLYSLFFGGKEDDS